MLAKKHIPDPAKRRVAALEAAGRPVLQVRSDGLRYRILAFCGAGHLVETARAEDEAECAICLGDFVCDYVCDLLAPACPAAPAPLSGALEARVERARALVGAHGFDLLQFGRARKANYSVLVVACRGASGRHVAVRSDCYGWGPCQYCGPGGR